MKKIAASALTLSFFLLVALQLTASPETDRIKRCRPIYDKCFEAAGKTSNPKYKDMDRDARNKAMLEEKKKCQKEYDECK